MTDSLPLDGAVLAGGESRRMGRDKALIELNGQTLVKGAVAALEAAGAMSVVVIGGNADAMTSLGLSHVPDLWPAEGPLGAIITALRSTHADRVAILACDLTAPSPRAISCVREALGDADVSVPVVDGRPEWLHAIWHRRVLPRLEQAFTEGERAPRRAVKTLRIAELHGGDPAWFHDADEPGDLPGHRR